MEILKADEKSGDYDRLKELKAFDETKAGVKGLVDSGVVQIPKIFIRPPDELTQELNNCRINSTFPVIDLSGIGESDVQRRKEVVDDVRSASEKWGFFQVLNHGIQSDVLEGMLAGIRRFHEQDNEMKRDWYARDDGRVKVRYQSNIDLYRSRAANWRDTLAILLLNSDRIEPEELPQACRDATMEFIKEVTKLGGTLMELLSEALGLKKEYLNDMECAKGRTIVCHYYPACPQPELTLGASGHTDPSFLTVLLQDQIGGLQVLEDGHWADVQPVPGAFVVNIGDLLQIMSNNRFKSVEHRVISNNIGPRVSTACFFSGTLSPTRKLGPIKELLSKDNPPLYREFSLVKYLSYFNSRPLGKSNLDTFKL